ncbi:RDD family protein [Falsiroseomonas selenitidurans]|uniref:RDD family protein n=1 Tax=Falsiroseomonas selenitidurans TaxID=2716335 RepID=A0ABX1DWJ4_9PROT|nr:RDD family protein [Falsiroseomonas selenitidurans]NKC29285.1 RDD family protein [Falsiroseomonas selenitidurans]
MPAPPSPFDGVLWRRIAAWVVDAALLLVLSWLIWGGAALAAVPTLGLLGGLLLLPWALLLPILYGTLSIGSTLSATPGQALLGLTVRSEADGAPPSLGQALTATVLHALSWAAGGLPLLAPLFSTRRRTLHDLFSGTLVLRVDALARSIPARPDHHDGSLA